METLLIALVQHTLDNCPKCEGSGEVPTSFSVGFGVPLKYVPCTACKTLRDAFTLNVLNKYA